MTREMRKGEIIHVKFPFSDLTGAKRRPALVLATEGTDVTLAFITTQLGQGQPYDALLQPSVTNGLHLPSLVRVVKVVTVAQRLVLGNVGELTPAELELGPTDNY